ncbi:chromate resistance protein ChrB domain-containing protein [Rhodoferax sp. PAMC 29310]|uniref:chromate resistance protein ChrB domain-containing protein n=1 Tax=Rhodoferax sp. PAMC 29310 TaxID=2822760 RepID=UPI001B33A035|nr:chromate resistance protein ChrB domain-containing protein [Rhodoferax sp. PAMC 29310]
MDTTKPPVFSCSPAELSAQLCSNDAPLLIDVRKNEAYQASPHSLPGALRRGPFEVEAWAATLPPATQVVVACVHGHEVSQTTMTALRSRGINAIFLQGGVEAWREQGYPTTAKVAGSATRWITRARPKIDRIACPWLIRRFVDTQAQFLYVPTEQVAAVAQREGAVVYDVAPSVAATEFSHDGDLCSFDAFIKHYRLGSDAALARLALIVRGADTDRPDLAPQCAGLVALSVGMSHIQADDHIMLETMMRAYDALYAWCTQAVAGQDEKHNWKPL